jgi:hypothetical protein
VVVAAAAQAVAALVDVAAVLTLDHLPQLAAGVVQTGTAVDSQVVQEAAEHNQATLQEQAILPQ